MRARHVQHAVPAFPVYSAAFLSDTDLVLGGGGGASKTGIKNKLRLYHVDEHLAFKVKDELELETGEDAPMSMAGHPDGATIICGINSSEKEIEKGENTNCRIYIVSEDRKIKLHTAISTLKSNSADDYQKVTEISPDGTMVAVGGSRDLTVLSLPGLQASSTQLDKDEIHDAAFSVDTLVIATTSQLFIHSFADSQAKSTKSSKPLSFVDPKTVDMPKLPGNVKGTFRAIKYHPIDPSIFYTVINTVPDRKAKGKVPARQGYIARWNSESWKVEAIRKVGDKGITTLDVSNNGQWIAFGSSDCSVRLLDSFTLTPLLSILKSHEFPPTILKFNPSSKLLVSGSADSTIRIIAIPQDLGEGSGWGLTIIIAIFALLFAVALQLILAGQLF